MEIRQDGTHKHVRLRWKATTRSTSARGGCVGLIHVASCRRSISRLHQYRTNTGGSCAMGAQSAQPFLMKSRKMPENRHQDFLLNARFLFTNRCCAIVRTSRNPLLTCDACASRPHSRRAIKYHNPMNSPIACQMPWSTVAPTSTCWLSICIPSAAVITIPTNSNL